MRKYLVVRSHSHKVDDALVLLATEVDKFLSDISAKTEVNGGVSVNYIPANGQFLVAQALTIEVDSTSES